MELTREQVERILSGGAFEIAALLDHDAALRHVLAQRAQEIERLNTDLKHRSMLATPADCTIEQNKLLRIQLTAMTAERDAFITGGVTEELLRKQDGFLKVGKGCLLVLKDDYEHLQSALAASEQEAGRLRNVLDAWTHGKPLGPKETA